MFSIVLGMHSEDVQQIPCQSEDAQPNVRPFALSAFYGRKDGGNKESRKKGSYANRHVTSDTKISLDVVDLYNRLLK